MDPQSNDFQFGKLTTEIDNLSKAVYRLSHHVETLSGEIGEIKLFRAKVVGASVALSMLASGVIMAAEKLIGK